MRGNMVGLEVLGLPKMIDRFQVQGKSSFVILHQNSNAAIDSLVACKFAFFGASLEEYAELLAGTTGEDHTPQSLKEIGERIWLTERSYNARNGFTRADDVLPERFFTEAGSSGEGIDVPPNDRARFGEELTKYYRIRGLRDDGFFPDDGFLDRQP